MKKSYKIVDDEIELNLSKTIYPLIVVKKVLANFMIENYIKLEEYKNNIKVYIKFKNNPINLIDELYNEFLRESLRYEISVETKNLRELIVGRALYTTCIEIDEKENSNSKDIEKIDEQDYDIDDIAVNWFDKFETKEEKEC